MEVLKKISLFLFALILFGACTKIAPIGFDSDGDGGQTMSLRSGDIGDDVNSDDNGSITDPDDDGDDIGNGAIGGITDADDDGDDGGTITDPDDDGDDDIIIIDDTGGKGDTGGPGEIIKG